MRPVVGRGVSIDASAHLGTRREVPAPDITDEMADRAQDRVTEHARDEQEAAQFAAMLGLEEE